jgi:hypothetical protein
MLGIASKTKDDVGDVYWAIQALNSFHSSAQSCDRIGAENANAARWNGMLVIVLEDRNLVYVLTWMLTERESQAYCAGTDDMGNAVIVSDLE